MWLCCLYLRLYKWLEAELFIVLLFFRMTGGLWMIVYSIQICGFFP